MKRRQICSVRFAGKFVLHYPLISALISSMTAWLCPRRSGLIAFPVSIPLSWSPKYRDTYCREVLEVSKCLQKKKEKLVGVDGALSAYRQRGLYIIRSWPGRAFFGDSWGQRRFRNPSGVSRRLNHTIARGKLSLTDIVLEIV